MVSINCHKLTNSFTKKITVTTNDPEHRLVYLICKGTILEAIRVSPKNLSFGRIPRSSGPQTKKVTITQGDGGPLALKLLGETPKSIKAKLNEVEPGKRYELEVTLSPPFSTDRVSANLKMETGVADAPTASIRVFATVSPRVAAQPKTFKIPDDRDPDWGQTIKLTWDDDKPLKISRATIDNPKLSVRLDEQEDKQVIVLQALPDYTPRPRRHYITLFTDDPGTPKVKVAVTLTSRTKSRGARPTAPLSRRIKETKAGKAESGATATTEAKSTTANPRQSSPK